MLERGTNMKPQKQKIIINKTDLYETRNYGLFEPDLQCQNPIRVNYLCTKGDRKSVV